jgi:hypothetical protein
MIVIKAIKPKPINLAVFQKYATEAVRRTVDTANTEFAKTYATWDNKPPFTKTIKATGLNVEGEVFTTDQVYAWVNNGTPPHLIPKAGPGLLAFSEGYTAKTMPGVLYSRSGGSFGNKVIGVMQVHHPGTKPRLFDKAVATYTNPWFKYWGDYYMKIAAKESGHAL